MPQAGHKATALPVAASTVSAAVSISASAGWASRNNEARPAGSEVTSPQSRRHARCLDTVDCASPQRGHQVGRPRQAAGQPAHDHQPGQQTSRITNLGVSWTASGRLQ
jgi:hypothetical protein